MKTVTFNVLFCCFCAFILTQNVLHGEHLLIDGGVTMPEMTQQVVAPRDDAVAFRIGFGNSHKTPEFMFTLFWTRLKKLPNHRRKDVHWMDTHEKQI